MLKKEVLKKKVGGGLMDEEMGAVEKAKISQRVEVHEVLGKENL